MTLERTTTLTIDRHDDGCVWADILIEHGGSRYSASFKFPPNMADGEIAFRVVTAGELRVLDLISEQDMYEQLQLSWPPSPGAGPFD